MTDKKHPDSGANTAHVVDNGLGGQFVQAERHEAKPVEGTLIIDLTASRKDTRDDFVRDFTEGSAAFENLIEEVSALGNVALTLIVHNGDGVRNYGRFESPNELAAVLADIECVAEKTQIEESLDIVPSDTHFVIVNADTTDGDKVEALQEMAELLGVPVIPLLEETKGQAGTTQEHRDTLRLMGEASGVHGGPFPYQTRMSLLDFVAVSAAATRGQAAIDELKAKGDIPQEVWDAIPQEALLSIAEAAVEANQDVTPERAVARAIEAGVVQFDNKGAQIANMGIDSDIMPSVSQSDNSGVQIANVAKGAHVYVTVVPAGVTVGTTPPSVGANPTTLPQNRTHTPLNGQPIVPDANNNGAPNLRRYAPHALAATALFALMAGVGGFVGSTLAHGGDNQPHVAELTGMASTPLDRFNAITEESILFESGSTVLSTNGMNMLARAAEIVRADPDGTMIGCIAIHGHSSETGSTAANQLLSEARARVVRNHLVDNLGLSPEIIQFDGFGQDLSVGGNTFDDQRVNVAATLDGC